MSSKHETSSFLTLQDHIDAALLSSRRILIGNAIDNDLAEDVIKKVWYLEKEDSKKPITFIINSPGGSIDAGFAIWDQMQMIKCPKITVVTGIAASMGSILMLAGDKKKRFATPMSRVMIHQPALSGVVQGQATDLEIQAKEILKMKEQIIEIYMHSTGKTKEAVEKALDRDTWMTAKEAMKWGLVDSITSSFDDL